MDLAKSRRKSNLCGQVVDELGGRIVAGEVQPGHPLPQEWTLCDSLGVSRTVVREAIKSLAAKGLVESRAKRGTVVRAPRQWNFLDADVLGWQVESGVKSEHLFHLMELRRTVEPAAARIAAERATTESVELIAAAYQEMRRTADDVDAYLVADTQFHVEILHATENPFFAPIANVIGVTLESSLRLTNRQPDENRASLPVHEKVFKAIRDQKPAAAEKAMRLLLQEAADRIDEAEK